MFLKSTDHPRSVASCSVKRNISAFGKGFRYSQPFAPVALKKLTPSSWGFIGRETQRGLLILVDDNPAIGLLRALQAMRSLVVAVLLLRIMLWTVQSPRIFSCCDVPKSGDHPLTGLVPRRDV